MPFFPSGFGSTAPAAGAGGAGFLGGLGDNSQAALIGGGIGLLGNVLSGIGQGKMSEAQLQQARELALRQEQLSREQLAQQGARTGLAAQGPDPLAFQRERQQQALLAAILPQLRNVSVSSNVPGMNRFIPQVSGGLRLPEGGFDAATLAYFSPEARANAEGQYWRGAAPFTPPPDLSQVGYGQAGAGVTAPAAQAHQQADLEAKQRNAALLAAIQQMARGGEAKKGSSKGSKALSALGGAATGAKAGSMVMPGLGTAIGAGIGGLIGLFR